MALLAVRLLGFPVFEWDARPVKLARRKTAALLAYLCSESAQSHSRESLSALFWPEMGSVEAAASLRRALWEIHQAAGGEHWLQKDGALLRVNPAATAQAVSVDLNLFAERLACGVSLAAEPAERIAALVEAAAVYRGDFMAGFTLRDSPAFDEWQAVQSQAWREKFAQALQTLASLYLNLGEGDLAVAAARRWLALDGLNEQAHRALMHTFDHLGQRSAALRQYDECTRLLQTELGVAPAPETRQLLAEIRAHKEMPAGLPQTSSPAPLTARAEGQTRPPAFSLPSTPFIGREAELEKLTRLLDTPECRLILLVGPGGMGKTRLALQALYGQTNPPGSFADGLYWVPLAGIDDLNGALRALAAAVSLPLRESPAKNNELQTLDEVALNQLAQFFAGRRCLLGLDNLEHLAGVGKLVAELLARAPGLKVLATSRQRLNLPEEWTFEVSGLPLPGYHDRRRLNTYASVQLFLTTAERVSSHFVPDINDWPAISRICQLVEGAPLGLELAAAWVKMFSCSEIAAEVERNLDFLTAQAASPRQPERQQSLRATFEYSWRLLPEVERCAFRKMAVFEGGFNRDAAAQVAGAGISVLSSLIDHCLLRRMPGGRFEFHEVLRQYAAEKLAAEPEEWQRAHEFHSQFYLDTLLTLAEELKGGQQLAALAALRLENKNLEQAWRFALTRQQWSRLRRAAPALILFYEMSAQKNLAYRLLLETRKKLAALPASTSQKAEVLALSALAAAGLKRFHQQGQLSEQDRRLHREALALLEGLPEGYDLAFALLLLNIGPGIVPVAEAAGQVRRCLPLFEAQADEWGLALANLILGDITNFGLHDAQSSRLAYTASLEYFENLGNAWGRVLCCVGLGALARKAGALEEAASLWEESLFFYQQVADFGREAEVRAYWAEARAAAGALEEAARAYEMNVLLGQQQGDERLVAYNRIQWAEVLVGLKREEEAFVQLQSALAGLYQAGDGAAVQRLQARAAQLFPGRRLVQASA